MEMNFHYLHTTSERSYINFRSHLQENFYCEEILKKFYESILIIMHTQYLHGSIFYIIYIQCLSVFSSASFFKNTKMFLIRLFCR